MDKKILVCLSDNIAFNPDHLAFVRRGQSGHGGKPLAALSFGGPIECQLGIEGEELKAFNRWLDDHSTGDYLKGGSKELGW